MGVHDKARPAPKADPFAWALLVMAGILALLTGEFAVVVVLAVVAVAAQLLINAVDRS